MLYRILHPKCTVHYAATKEVARAVSDDLISRYGDKTEVTECKDTRFMIDFGGIAFQGEKPVEFDVEGFTYSIWAHQYLMALNKLNINIENPRAGNYIKIHGAWTSIAMPLSHAEQLRDAIKAIKENNILKMYVDENVIHFMGSQAYEESLMKSEMIHATVAFFDICDFTSVSESESPDTVVKLLNEYFDLMAREIVAEHKPRLTKDEYLAMMEDLRK